MSDTPKFEVIDRRKMKAEEEQESQQPAHAASSNPPTLRALSRRRVRAWW